MILTFFLKIVFDGNVIVAKSSEKNNGEIFFDLTPAVFWGNDFLSCTHPIMAKNRNFFIYQDILILKTPIDSSRQDDQFELLLSKIRWKIRELTPFEKCRFSRLDPKIDIFQFWQKLTKLRFRWLLIPCRKIRKKY